MQNTPRLYLVLAHRAAKVPGVALVREADDEVVGIAHDDHVAPGKCAIASPRPLIEPLAQVDFGE